MEPKIAREFYLLSLNPKNGYYYNFGNEFGYGILGAMLMDLYRVGKISILNKKIILTDTTLCNYTFLDRIITIIQQKGELSGTRLLAKMAFRGTYFKKQLIEFLLLNKDIVKIQKKFIGIPYYRYYSRDRELKQSIVRRIRDILLRGEKPFPDEMYLLTLIQICRLFRALSDKRDERKFMRSNLKNLLKNSSNYDHNYNGIILLQQSIRKAILASNAAQHAG